MYYFLFISKQHLTIRGVVIDCLANFYFLLTIYLSFLNYNNLLFLLNTYSSFGQQLHWFIRTDLLVIPSFLGINFAFSTKQAFTFLIFSFLNHLFHLGYFRSDGFHLSSTNFPPSLNYWLRYIKLNMAVDQFEDLDS